MILAGRSREFEVLDPLPGDVEVVGVYEEPDRPDSLLVRLASEEWGVVQEGCVIPMVRAPSIRSTVTTPL